MAKNTKTSIKKNFESPTSRKNEYIVLRAV